jgi:hypothetical protein
VDDELLHQFRNGEFARTPTRRGQATAIGQPLAEHAIVLFLARFGAVRPEGDVASVDRDDGLTGHAVTATGRVSVG